MRFRVDGVLRDALVTSATIHPSVVARIKIVARLDTIETRRPQDGRAKVSQGDRSDIGMTFAAALRSILRQDPDIVMVGEIRDAETARICLQAAMTGHLVLSTLHTNDAVGAIPRLFDLDVDPALVANSLLGVMAQRLARTVCPSCAHPQTYTDAELSDLIGDVDIETPIDGKRGAGCSRCRGSGQRGRTALVELVVATPRMQHLIANRADRGALLAQARQDGTHLLVESGVQKIADGVCTPDDVREVAAAEVEGDSPSRSAKAVPASVARGRTRAPLVAPAPAPVPAAASAPVASDALPCGACGVLVQSGWKFCPACAAPVLAAAGPVALVCDDDPIARRVACAALRRDFGQVLEASSGAQALDIVACKNPDVLVIDQNMPGMSGIDVIRELRSHLETAMLPILMLTAAQDDETEEESFEAGANDYLRKPISPARLRTRARVVLAAHERVRV